MLARNTLPGESGDFTMLGYVQLFRQMLQNINGTSYQSYLTYISTHCLSQTFTHIVTPVLTP